MVEIDYVQGTYHGKTVIFVARHGKDHTIPPHKINYRANIWGAQKIRRYIYYLYDCGRFLE